ncbi:MAG: hypothetical protein M1400_02390 [Patescibacteria group bacterium]|nr:hypothetical protein [Patescibacteria group bacterium]
MLKDILESKSESVILAFFLAAPVRSFSVPEISKRLRLPHLKAARALNRLATAGPLKSFSKKGKKYYLLNQKYQLLPEIKNALVKYFPKYQDELFAAVRQLGSIRAAFLSGIFTGMPELPVDLLLVGRVNLQKLDQFLKGAHKMMGQEINYSIMTPQEFVLRRDTFDKFIRDIFDYRHIVVCDDLKKTDK